ncbi:phage tail assembly chaperone family protein, TAC [Acinetobacter lactucae]|nr:phage tail assembly chaperone family protein, TAC [Acinetobacter lactucae]
MVKIKMAKKNSVLSLKDIAQGALIGEIREAVVEFLHNGKIETVEVRLKQLPFAVTEPLYTRLQKGENVFAEWVALCLVDENGETYLTKKQVADNFTQALANALFPVIIGLDDIKKNSEGK